MTILALADWWERLPVMEASWSLPAVGDVIEARGGSVQVVSTSTRQWEVTVRLAARATVEARALEALLDLASTPGTAVEVSPSPWQVPALDIAQTAYFATPLLDSVSADGYALSIFGLAPGYPLSVGDFLSVEMAGQSGARIVRMYRLQESAAADASGIAGPVKVTPRVDGAVLAGSPVKLIAPIMLGVLLPSEIRRGRIRPGLWGGASVTIRQSLSEVAP